MCGALANPWMIPKKKEKKLKAFYNDAEQKKATLKAFAYSKLSKVEYFLPS